MNEKTLENALDYDSGVYGDCDNCGATVHDVYLYAIFECNDNRGDRRFCARCISKTIDDLVKALKQTLDALYNETHGDDDTPWMCGVKADARAALAKADGK